MVTTGQFVRRHYNIQKKYYFEPFGTRGASKCFFKELPVQN